MKKILVSAAAAIALAGSAATLANPKQQAEHRDAVMEAIGGHFSAIFATLKAPEVLPDNHQFHAQSIARLAEIATGIFPEGSDFGKSEALPAIWEQPEDFKKQLDTFVERANALEEASTSGDMKTFVAAAKDLGGSCKSCHDDYRD